MIDRKIEIVKYRISSAKETLDDAKILAQNKKWNSSINRLYYAVTALLLDANINPSSHNGVKSKFSENFILTQKISKEFEKIIRNYLLGAKKEIMTTSLILTEKR
jgi:uncharacterized protein (UPF0332 family)